MFILSTLSDSKKKFGFGLVLQPFQCIKYLVERFLNVHLYILESIILFVCKIIIIIKMSHLYWDL